VRETEAAVPRSADFVRRYKAKAKRPILEPIGTIPRRELRATHRWVLPIF
jgi:hypothetical protein